MEPVNILLLGETGVGKSTLVNSFMNYLSFDSLDQAKNAQTIHTPIPSYFTITDANFQAHTIQFGDDGNESMTPGVSSTQAIKSHLIEVDNVKVQFIDTPGIADTGGIGNDDKNFKRLLSTVGKLKNIHGICIVLKADNTRLNVVFEYCIRKLLHKLHKNASRNFVFVFTNSRGSFYKPGNALIPLQEILQQIKSRPPYITIPLNEDNVFCLDNEAFRFLIAKRTTNMKFNEEEKINFGTSWTISTEVCRKFLAYIRSIQPHKIQETVSLNEVHRKISKLGVALGEATRYIQMNIRMNNRYIKELSDRLEGRNVVNTFPIVPTIDLKIIPLPYPATVCTNERCVTVTKIEDICQKIVTKCHSPCYLKGVSKEVKGHSLLSKCWAMDDKNNTKICKHDSCGHHFKEHMHVADYLTEIQLKFVSTEINLNMQPCIQTEINNIIKEMSEANKTYKTEMITIQRSMAQLSHLLKKNAIMPYEDTYKKYLESLIDSEMKMADANEDLIQRYRQLISDYETKRKDYEEKTSLLPEADLKVLCTDEYMTIVIENLYDLPHTENIEDNQFSHTKDYNTLHILRILKKQSRVANAEIETFVKILVSCIA